MLLGSNILRSHYGPLALDYFGRIEDNGSTITPARKANIQNLLYKKYSDGAGGEGAIVDFRTAFEGSNAGLFPFYGDDLTAARVPLLGNGGLTLTNNGFIAGDYSASGGIQGDGSSWLVSGIATNTVDVGNCFILIAHQSVSSASVEFLLGGGLRLYFYKNSANGIVGQLQDSTVTNALSAGTIAGNIHSWNATSLSNCVSQQDGANDTTHTVVRVQPASTFALSFFSQGPGGASIGSALIQSGLIANRSLTATERTIATNAIADFIANR